MVNKNQQVNQEMIVKCQIVVEIVQKEIMVKKNQLENQKELMVKNQPVNQELMVNQIVVKVVQKKLKVKNQQVNQELMVKCQIVVKVVQKELKVKKNQQVNQKELMVK